MSTRPGVRRVVAKTADYTVTAARDENGTLFTNRGAGGAVIFTLPPASSRYAGWHFRFRTVAGQNVTVKPSAVDTLLVFNDATADSLAASTADELIGALIEAECDGTVWAASVLSNLTTPTVAT
jgi:hypothetical protein